nr:hypothetical protein Iba_chr04fCG14170 [Ipomoea batatas]
MSDTDSQNLSFDNYDAMVEYNTVIKEVQQFTEVQGELVGTSTEHYAKDPSTKTILDLNEAGTSTRVTSNQTLLSAPSSSRPTQIQAPILTSGRHKCLSAEQARKDFMLLNSSRIVIRFKKESGKMSDTRSAIIFSFDHYDAIWSRLCLFLLGCHRITVHTSYQGGQQFKRSRRYWWTPEDYATGNLQEPRYNLKKKYLPNTKNVTIAISSAVELS